MTSCMPLCHPTNHINSHQTPNGIITGSRHCAKSVLCHIWFGFNAVFLKLSNFKILRNSQNSPSIQLKVEKHEFGVLCEPYLNTGSSPCLAQAGSIHSVTECLIRNQDPSTFPVHLFSALFIPFDKILSP